jgi:mannosidase alpha-like ER degradation enhancer 2
MKPELWYGHADMNTGQRTATTYGALDAFFPAVLALSGDLNRASLLQESSYKMWMKHGIEPEEFNYQTMEVVSPGYPLRPEIVESTYYLYHYSLLGARTARPHASFRRGTRPSQAAQVPPLNESSRKLDADYYQRMGAMMFQDFVKYCRTDEGYAALKSVVTKEKTDSMQSFLFAETFKYFYLLFAPPKTLDFNKVIFNTEAHPVLRMR